MYYNIGGKLKVFAYFQMIIELIIGVSAGIYFLKENLIVVGILFLLFSPLFAWVTSCITYGIGVAADNSYYNRYNDTMANSKKDLEPIFHDEESISLSHNNFVVKKEEPLPPPITSEKDLKSAITIRVNSHNECFCPNCDTSLVFDNIVGLKKCNKCNALLKIVKT